MLTATLDLLAKATAAKCPVCSEPALGPVCSRCTTTAGFRGTPHQATVTVASTYSRLYFFAHYHAPGRERTTPIALLLRRFKYERDRRAGHALAAILRRYAYLIGNDYDVIVPIPLHSTRLLQRGFNQAAWFARAASHSIGVPVAWNLLHRTGDSGSQVGRGAIARRRAMAQAFQADGDKSAGNRVLVVDDVVTTGATVTAAAVALTMAAASRVDILALLRADRPLARHE